MRSWVFGAAFIFVGWVSSPAEANKHCGTILETAEEIFQSLLGDSTGEICKTQLEAARELMLKGRDQAAACGCGFLERGFESQIEASKKTDYECWNIRQGIRSTIVSSLGDSVDMCHGG